MSEWRMVPYEPTPEMVEAALEGHMPFGDMDLAIRLAILAAPPYAELASGQHDQCPHCGGGGIDERTGSLCGGETQAQQLAKQQQPASERLAFDTASHIINLLELDLCGCYGACRCRYMETKKVREALLAVFANHQDAPDVSELVAALDDAATSLETLTRAAVAEGHGIETAAEVRGCANSRAMAARAARDAVAAYGKLEGDV